jgi:AbiU2
MSHETADDQLKKYSDSMGKELGSIFHHCRQKFVAVTSLWDIYCVLIDNKDRIDLFNRSSGFVAFTMHWQFLSGTILGLLRLLDPPKSMGKVNLTLQSLSSLCSVEFSKQVEQQVANLVSQTKGLKEVRNKILAHNDLRQATNEDGPLEIESRKTITTIIQEILSLLNQIENFYMKSTTFIIPLGNDPAFKLLHRLWVADHILKRASESRREDGFKITHEELNQMPDYLKVSERENRRYN